MNSKWADHLLYLVRNCDLLSDYSEKNQFTSAPELTKHVATAVEKVVTSQIEMY